VAHVNNVDRRAEHTLPTLRSERENNRAGVGGGDHTGGGNEPPGGTDVEPRVAKLESHFEYIRRDLDSIVIDLREFRSEMRDEFKAVRTDMQNEFKAVRTEIQNESKTIRTDMQNESKAIRTDMQSELKAVRTDMREDFRIMFASLVAVVLGMTGLLAKGFGWL
jgi:DNA anti-recombination protein RmuC